MLKISQNLLNFTPVFKITRPRTKMLEMTCQFYVIRSRSLNFEFCGSLSMYMLCMLYINRLTVIFKIFW